MIIVTGGAGFVGANTVHELNKLGESEILVVDNLHSSANAAHPKFLNLAGARFTDYMDKREFRASVAQGKFAGKRIRAILHNGACSNTLEDNGEYMMDNNFTYSKELLHFATDRKIPFVYASTAAVYGLSGQFSEVPENERPLNVYGFSKLAFDNYVRARFDQFDSTVVGLRYFNVYGPYETHKGRMASVMYHFTKQLKETGTIKMFQGSGGYGDGEQRRDFVFVRDLVNIAFYFAGLTGNSGVKKAVVNAGTGKARTFKDVAAALMAVHGQGKIEFIPFPADLNSRYQHLTEADITGLRNNGWARPFTSLEEGISSSHE
ncbi:ADP-glyceromanno-heptose 6-epimerase [Solimonas flava]|uniref:ADP-glyceromanno-heptose 6-epimerase n=1 Tax=Solimonas flava TaxID=415849 RepID=UPI0004105516|nr:ADP-glyceromanno-heptose 6-epimerase [Solimonas flava]